MKKKTKNKIKKVAKTAAKKSWDVITGKTDLSSAAKDVANSAR